MHAPVPNNTILLFPLPYILVQFPYHHHHKFYILVILHWYTSSWETICLVPTAIKHRPKMKATPSSRIFCHNDLRLTLDLVRIRVYPIIRHLHHFYQIWIDGVTNLDLKIPPRPQLDQYTLFHKNIT